MIGKVVFPYKSMVAEAVMEDDGSWRCDAIPCLVRPLNILHGPTSFEARLDRSRSLCCLASAARWLHGEIRTGETRAEWGQTARRSGEGDIPGSGKADIPDIATGPAISPFLSRYEDQLARHGPGVEASVRPR
jgi:hypothetical protein